MSEAGVERTTRRVLVSAAFALLVAVAVASALRDDGDARAGAHALAGSRVASLTRPHVPSVLARGPGRTSMLGVPRPGGISSQAHAAVAGTPCGKTPGLLCSQVDVPLDRTGLTPGTISLHVETLPALGASRGVLFLIAGGPGQGSSHAFDLGDPGNAEFNRFLFPGYTLVAYDDRGTGSSGVLRCPGLQTATSSEAEASFVSSCAETIGPQRVFYSTTDHVEGLEAVRQSLGVERVALFGVSYGTKLAMAYALAHPTHVERLLLDSVLPPELPDPFFSNVLRDLPSRLASLCTNGACREATSDFAGDVAAVGNALDAKPVTGKVLQPNGKTRSQRITADDLLSVVVDADLNPGLAAELPAIMHEARLGDLRPLLRIFRLDRTGSIEAPEDLSSGLFAATTCRDGPFPWQPDTAIADRPALFKAAVDALPADSFGPFGRWAARLGNAHFCLRWPTPSGGAAFGPGPLPDVPVLAVNGGFDMRTPVASAVAVAARFPQGRVLVVPGVGHSVVTADPSACAAFAVRDWILGKPVPAECPRPKPYLDPVPAFPPVRSDAQKTLQTAPQTLVTASKTLREAQGIWLMTLGGAGRSSGSVAGLYGGKLVASGENAFTLVRYSVVPGVELSGTLRVTGFGPPIRFDGVVRVGGTAAATGVLGVAGSRVGGTLDGQIVGR